MSVPEKATTKPGPATTKRQRAPVPEHPRAWRLNDFCLHYGIGRTKAFEMIRSGELESVLVGSRRLIPAEAAEALLRSHGGAK